MQEYTKRYLETFSVWKNNIPEIKVHDNEYKWILKNHNKIYDYIKKTYTNLGTLKSHINVLGMMMKKFNKPLLYKKYSKESTDINDEYKKSFEDQNHDIENFIPFKDIEKKRDEYKKLFENDKTNNKLNLMYLILSLYTYQPPLRMNYDDMMIVNKIPDNDNNYMLNKNGKYYVIINHDKISNKLGSATFELNDKLNDIINESLSLFPRKYILSTQNDGDKPINKQGFESLMKQMFKNQKISIVLLRSAYITHMYSKPNFTVRDKKELASKMRQTYEPNIQELHYQKLLNPEVETSKTKHIKFDTFKEEEIKPINIKKNKFDTFKDTEVVPIEIKNKFVKNINKAEEDAIIEEFLKNLKPKFDVKKWGEGYRSK